MGLTPDQWENVKELFEAALERPAAERASFLVNSCSDSLVRNEVERLLANHNAGSSFLSRPLPSPGASSPTQSFASGDLLAERFRILRFLASGGMGEVYEAEDTELGERVALKTIRPDLLRDGRSLKVQA